MWFNLDFDGYNACLFSIRIMVWSFWFDNGGISQYEAHFGGIEWNFTDLLLDSKWNMFVYVLLSESF